MLHGRAQGTSQHNPSPHPASWPHLPYVRLGLFGFSYMATLHWPGKATSQETCTPQLTIAIWLKAALCLSGFCAWFFICCHIFNTVPTKLSWTLNGTGTGRGALALALWGANLTCAYLCCHLRLTLCIAHLCLLCFHHPRPFCSLATYVFLATPVTLGEAVLPMGIDDFKIGMLCSQQKQSRYVVKSLDSGRIVSQVIELTRKIRPKFLVKKCHSHWMWTKVCKMRETRKNESQIIENTIIVVLTVGKLLKDHLHTLTTALDILFRFASRSKICMQLLQGVVLC